MTTEINEINKVHSSKTLLLFFQVFFNTVEFKPSFTSNRGIIGEVPRCFPDLFLTVIYETTYEGIK